MLLVDGPSLNMAMALDGDDAIVPLKYFPCVPRQDGVPTEVASLEAALEAVEKEEEEENGDGRRDSTTAAPAAEEEEEKRTTTTGCGRRRGPTRPACRRAAPTVLPLKTTTPISRR